MVMGDSYEQYVEASKSITKAPTWTEEGWAGLTDVVRLQIMNNLKDAGAWWKDVVDDFTYDRYLAARRAAGHTNLNVTSEEDWNATGLAMRRFRIAAFEQQVADKPESEVVAW